MQPTANSVALMRETWMVSRLRARRLMAGVGQLTLSRMDESVIPNGTCVKHSTKPIQGRVVGVTRIKKLFERADDAFEYRVQTLDGEIKICSESNVIPQVPDGRYSHCYRCGLQVDPNSVECPK